MLSATSCCRRPTQACCQACHCLTVPIGSWLMSQPGVSGQHSSSTGQAFQLQLNWSIGQTGQLRRRLSVGQAASLFSLSVGQAANLSSQRDARAVQPISFYFTLHAPPNKRVGTISVVGAEPARLHTATYHSTRLAAERDVCRLVLLTIVCCNA